MGARRWKAALCCVLAGSALTSLEPGTVRACGWDWETFAAEATRLPCVNDVIIGAFGKHTREYYERTLADTELALSWAPYYTEALDARGMALLHLGRLKEAEATMKQRLEAAPEAYPAHANLGTLYTFSGDYEAAGRHVDRALSMDPEAHFGREKYHRQLIMFLREKASAKPEAPRNFLNVELSDAQRFFGNPKRFEEAGLKADVFDALSAMIAVYGAERLPDIYFTLGDALALRGETKLAWGAYQRSVELGHPAAATIRRYQARLLEIVAQRSSQRRDRGTGDMRRPGGYYGLSIYYANARAQAAESRSIYESWERAQLRAGLRPWSDSDVARVYRRMDQLKQRCKTPRAQPGLSDSRRITPEIPRCPRCGATQCSRADLWRCRARPAHQARASTQFRGGDERGSALPGRPRVSGASERVELGRARAGTLGLGPCFSDEQPACELRADLNWCTRGRKGAALLGQAETFRS